MNVVSVFFFEETCDRPDSICLYIAHAKPPAGSLTPTKTIVHGFLYKQGSAEALSLDSLGS